jgi:hypothetical protein
MCDGWIDDDRKLRLDPTGHSADFGMIEFEFAPTRIDRLFRGEENEYCCGVEMLADLRAKIYSGGEADTIDYYLGSAEFTRDQFYV